MASAEPSSTAATFDSKWRKSMGPNKKQTVRFRCGSRRWDMSISVAVVNSSVLRKFFDNPSQAINLPLYHASIMDIGCRYEISGLGRLADTRYVASVTGDFWKQAEFAETIRQCYAEKPQLLTNPVARGKIRSLLVSLAKRHVHQLLASEMLGTAFRDVTRTTPEFAYDLLCETFLLGTSVPPPIVPTPSAAPAASSNTPAAAPTLPKNSANRNTSTATPAQTTALETATAAKTTATPASASTQLPAPAPPSLKRKRTNMSNLSETSARQARKCTICTGTFFCDRPWSCDDIHTRQCRTCADQLERVVNFDEHDGYGRRVF